MIKNNATGIILRKFIYLILTAMLTIVPGCGAPSPGDTIKEMYKKVCDTKSMTPMLEYASPESLPMISMVSSMAENPMKGPQIKADLKKRCDAGIKVISEETNGDLATVVINMEKNPMKLRKIDGKWKMVVSKN